MKKTLLLLCLAISLSITTHAKTIYANITQISSPQDGATWATAYKTIQSAIDAAVAGDEVWVAQGAYYSSGANNFVLVLKEGVEVYGGFKGDEGTVIARNWQTYPTIIYAFEKQAIACTNLTNASIIDGFTIKPPDFSMTGARGVYSVNSAPVIRNCTFQNLETLAFSELNGDGAAMYNDHSQPQIINCSFLNNTSIGKGGAIYNSNGSAISISNTIISGNTSQYGGAIYNNSSDMEITRCSITGNQYATVHAAGNGGGICSLGGNLLISNTLIANNNAASFGGAIYNFESNLTIVNCTITGNSSSSNWAGPAIYNSVLAPATAVEIINNSIIWNNTGFNPGEVEIAGNFDPTVSNSIIKDGLFGAIDKNPEFKAENNYMLSPFSPAINIGSSTFASDYGNLDLTGNPRIFGDNIDLGAYEAQEDPNIITNNGNDNFVGFNGAILLSGNDIKIGETQPFQWEIRTVGGAAPTDTTTYLIDPADFVPYKAVLAAQGITLDSNSLIINDLSKLPTLMALLAPDATTDWANFTGVILFNRIVATLSTSNTLKVTFQPTPLPVKLSDFSGHLKNGTAVLEWHSDLETNFGEYILEKSTDGKNFPTTWTILPKGSNQNYLFGVAQLESKAIYRLKLIDKNGTFTYYRNLVTLSSNTTLSQILLYPNPAKDYINCQVALSGSIMIFDVAGRLVKTQVLQVGINKINISGLIAGVYYCNINGQKAKFVKIQ